MYICAQVMLRVRSCDVALGRVWDMLRSCAPPRGGAAGLGAPPRALLVLWIRANAVRGACHRVVRGVAEHLALEVSSAAPRAIAVALARAESLSDIVDAHDAQLLAALEAALLGGEAPRASSALSRALALVERFACECPALLAPCLAAARAPPPTAPPERDADAAAPAGADSSGVVATDAEALRCGILAAAAAEAAGWLRRAPPRWPRT